MTTAIEDLWPEDLVKIDIPSPKEILMEQAHYLSDRTKNLLIGEVKTTTGMIKGEKGISIIHEFIIKAPSMGNYQFVLLQVIHDLSIYPLIVLNELSEERFDVNDEGHFKSVISHILGSNLVKNAITALIGPSFNKSQFNLIEPPLPS